MAINEFTTRASSTVLSITRPHVVPTVPAQRHVFPNSTADPLCGFRIVTKPIKRIQLIIGKKQDKAYTLRVPTPPRPAASLSYSVGPAALLILPFCPSPSNTTLSGGGIKNRAPKSRHLMPAPLCVRL